MSTAEDLGGARRSGRLQLDESFGPNDHAAWVYASDEERATAAAAWLLDGLRIGQRAFYVTDAPVDVAAAEVAPLMAPFDVGDLERRGALVIVNGRELYDLSVPIDPPAQLRVYDAAVEQAVADGFAGLRVAADVTPLLLDPTRHPAHLRWEQFADRYMTNHPLAPLCMYDARRVDGLDQLVACHALQGPHAAQFSLYADGADRARIVGELDALTDDVLTHTLRSMPAGDVAIDLSGLAFVDGRAAWRLHEELVARRRRARPITLAGAPPQLRRLWKICGFDPALLAA